MTNDTKAPERIWLTGFHKDQYGARLGRGTISDLDHSPNPDYPEYIRHDLHLSFVAAAYEDAIAKIAARLRVHAETYLETGDKRAALYWHHAADIAKTATHSRADAKAALEARDKQIRDKALKEVANYFATVEVDRRTVDTILALIEKDKTDE